MRRPQPRFSAALILLPPLLAACSSAPGKSGEAQVIEVTEVRRLTVCHTAETAAQLTPLANIAAVRSWQAAHGVDLFGDGDAGPVLPPGPFVMVEHGARGSGGYGIAIQHGAEVIDDELTLHGNFLEPPEQPARTQTPSSPCVLVALPGGSRVATLRLLDQAGDVRARRPATATINAAVPAQ